MAEKTDPAVKATYPHEDPALNPANQHTHAPRFHAPSAQADDTVYTTGTTVDPSSVPTQHNHVQQPHVHNPDSVDKAGVMPNTPPDYSDTEKTPAGVHNHEHSGTPTEQPQSSWKTGRYGWIWRYRRIIASVFLFQLFTGWWIASLILHRNSKNWVVPFLLWLCVMLRIVFWWVPSRHVSQPIKWVWQHTAVKVYDVIPEKFRSLAGGLVVVSAILVGAMATEESDDNTRDNRAMSLFGIAVIIFTFWATSKHRTKVNWRTVCGGMLAQYVIGLFVLRTKLGYDIFSWVAGRAGDLLGFAKDGVAFLTNEETANLGMFFFGVIPAIIFFISLVQVGYYVGFLQWFIKKFATFVFWALQVSGAEAVVAAATPFIGQGESAMLVRPFVPHMTKAEIHQIMTCGFATISGSVLVGYINMGLNKEALVSSCIMSIPASLAISKLRYPETEETLTAGRVVIPDDDEHKAENALHAFANGAYLGIKIAGTIIASILCIIAAVGLINGLLTWWGSYLNINDPQLTLQTIFSYIFFPIAALLGVTRDKVVILKVARLIAEKVVTNEFVAFLQLTDVEGDYQDLSIRTQVIATYALCGFGNIGSLGIQIGILGQLAPSRGGDVSRLAVSALISGVMATLTTAAIAGLVISDQASDFISQGNNAR